MKQIFLHKGSGAIDSSLHKFNQTPRITPGRRTSLAPSSESLETEARQQIAPPGRFFRGTQAPRHADSYLVELICLQHSWKNLNNQFLYLALMPLKIQALHPCARCPHPLLQDYGKKPKINPEPAQPSHGSDFVKTNPNVTVQFGLLITQLITKSSPLGLPELPPVSPTAVPSLDQTPAPSCLISIAICQTALSCREK